MVRSLEKALVVYGLIYFLPTGISLGLLAGMMIGLKAVDVQSAGTMAGYFFNFLNLIVFLLLFFLTFKKRTYWLSLLNSDISEEFGRAIGQVIGLAIGGSLLVSFFYWVTATGTLYLLGPFDTAGLYNHVSGLITMNDQLILAGVATLAALLALGWIWRRQKQESMGKIR